MQCCYFFVFLGNFFEELLFLVFFLFQLPFFFCDAHFEFFGCEKNLRSADCVAMAVGVMTGDGGGGNGSDGRDDRDSDDDKGDGIGSDGGNDGDSDDSDGDGDGWGCDGVVCYMNGSFVMWWCDMV